MKINKHEIDMCNGPLFGKILLFTIPLMLSGVLQLLFNAADDRFSSGSLWSSGRVDLYGVRVEQDTGNAVFFISCNLACNGSGTYIMFHFSL